MKRLLVIVALAFGLAAAGEAAQPSPAKCAACAYNGRCLWNTTCGEGCLCIKRTLLELWGDCYPIKGQRP